MGNKAPEPFQNVGKPLYLRNKGFMCEIIDPLNFSSLTSDFSAVGLIGIWGQFCCGIKYNVKNSPWC